MKCDAARARILEADLSELRRRSGSPLARHLEECPRCRSLAEEVVAGEEALAAALAERVPPADVEWILARARDPGRRGRRRRLRIQRRWLPLPLAAAAVLALLLVARHPSPPPELDSGARSRAFHLEVPSGRPVAVIETADPDITLVWIF